MTPGSSLGPGAHVIARRTLRGGLLGGCPVRKGDRGLVHGVRGTLIVRYDVQFGGTRLFVRRVDLAPAPLGHGLDQYGQARRAQAIRQGVLLGCWLPPLVALLVFLAQGGTPWQLFAALLAAALGLVADVARLLGPGPVLIGLVLVWWQTRRRRR